MGVGVVALSLLVPPLTTTLSAQEETLVEIDTALSQTSQGDVLDEATLQDLDELLRDPVRLVDGDLNRLLWIPWVSTAQLESLRAALPIRSLAAWSALPHWSERDVQRLQPFVVFAAPRQEWTAVHAQADLYEMRSGRRSIFSLGGGALHLAAQVDADAISTAAGFLLWDSPRSQLLVGDLRRTSGLGMLWSSRVLSSSAGASVAMTESWSGSASLWRDRVVRGVAARIHMRRASYEVVRAAAPSGDVLAANLSMSLPSMRVQVGGLRLRDQLWGNVFVQRGDTQQSVSMEVVQQPVGLAAAMLWRRVQRSWRMEAGAASAPQGVSSPLSRVASSGRSVGWSQVRLRSSWSQGPLQLRVGWAQTHWNAPTSQRHSSLSLQTIARSRLLRFEAHLRNDQTEEQELLVEAIGKWQQVLEHRLLLRVVFPLGDGMVSVERRTHSRLNADPSLPHGIGWRLGARQQFGPGEIEMAATFFEAAPGASVVFSEPSVGAAPALFYGTSAGMRFSTRIRYHWRHLRVSVRAGIGWVPEQKWQSVVEAGLRFTLPGTNAF